MRYFSDYTLIYVYRSPILNIVFNIIIILLSTQNIVIIGQLNSFLQWPCFPSVIHYQRAGFTTAGFQQLDVNQFDFLIYVKVSGGQ